MVGRKVMLLALAALVAPPAATQAADWTPFGQGSDATCADGSAVDYLERAADPTRVVLYLEGGGGCFDADTCAFDGEDKAYYSQSLATPEWLADRDGIFDLDEARNPLADYSWVYVPYCTGDVHLGNRSTTYAPDLVVEHRGYTNGLIALDHLAETYPDATEVVVAGISGGAVPTPLYAGLVSDRLPQAQVVAIADSSGAYPDIPALNGLVGTRWGTMDALPDWPEAEGMTVREWSIPGLYGVAAAHAPKVRFAKFDHAYDEAQIFYGQLAGVDADELLTLIDANDDRIASDGADVASYVAPGSGHTILDTKALYALEVEGVPLIDWISELIDGGRPADVHCQSCR